MGRLRFLAVALILCLQTVHASAGEQKFDSWQVRHPFMTGVAAALTFNLIPGAFGNDLQPVEWRMEKGWTRATFDLMYPHARRSFERSRTIICIFEVLILLALFIRQRRKRK